MRKKFVSDVVVYSLVPQLPRIANIFLLPFTTPFLNPIDFAVYGTVTAYVMGFEVLKTLGLDIILMNSFYKERGSYKTTWGKVEAIISIWSFLLSLLIALIVYFILPAEIEPYSRWFIVISTCVPSALFAGLSKIAVLYYQYNQKPGPIVIRSAILGILAVIINYYTIAELQLGYKGWFYSSLITGIVMPISYLHPIWTREKIFPIYRIKWDELLKMIKVSLPIVPHHYSNYFLNYSDRVFLNLFHIPNTQIGLYNLGYSISSNFRFITTSVDRVVGPTFHKTLLQGNGSVIIRRFVFMLAAAYLLIGFIGGIWMKECFQILIRNDELTGAYVIAIIVLFSFATRPLYNGAQSFLFFNERTSKLWRVTFMFGMINVILNLIFIPFFGINAAAVNTFICITGSNYGIFLLKDYLETSKINFFPLYWLAATLAVFAVSWFLKDASLFIKSVATVGALLATLSFIMMVRKDLVV